MSGPEPGGIAGAILRAASAHPDRLAIVHGSTQLTFGELAERTRLLADRLAADGLHRGDTAVIALHRGINQYTSILAVLLCGAAYVPIDPALLRARAVKIIDSSGARLVITDTTLEGVTLPSVDPGSATVTATAATAPPVDVLDSDLAYIIYTSGTTGEPKGVMVSHGAAKQLLSDLEAVLQLPTAPARVACNASLAFDASVQQWIRLCRGDTLVIVPHEVRADPRAFGRHLRDGEVTDLDLTPSQLRLLLPELADSTLERVLVGGEAIDPTLWEAVQQQGGGARYVNVYGPTEATVDAFWAVISEGVAHPTIGAPLPSVTASNVGPDLEQRLEHESGEIVLGGPRLAWGYRGDPRLTAIRFVPDPGGGGRRWYRTGDRGLVTDGRWSTLGREDDQWKVNGIRIESGEIAAAVRRLPGIRAAEMVRHPDSDRIFGFVVGSPPKDWRGLLAGELFPAAVPFDLVTCEQVPLTVNGKADHRRLRELLRARDSATVSRSEDPLEQLWRLHAGRAESGTNFVSCGGHSLAAILFLDGIVEQFGVRLSIDDLYSALDIEAFRELLTHADRGGEHLAPALPRRISPATPEQQALFVLHQLHPGITAYHVGSLDRLAGPLHIDTLRAAAASVINATDALRSRLRLLNDRLVLVLCDEGNEPELEFEELSLEAHDAAAEAFLEAPFALVDGPLFRARIWSTPDRMTHTLAVVGHHAVIDGWSLENVRASISAAYRGEYWPTPPSFLAWVALHSRDVEEICPDLIRRVAEVHDGDRTRPVQITGPRPLVARFRGGRSATTLVPQAWEQLRDLAQEQHATPFAVLLALWFVLLSKYSGTSEVVTGIPTAGAAELPRRTQAVGFFNETVPLRQDLPPDDTLRALIGRCAEQVRSVVSTRQVPFPLIVEALPHRRALGENPVFSSWCNLLSYPWRDYELTGVESRRLPDPVARPLFDLNVYFRDRNDALEIEVIFDADLHAPDRIEALRDHLRGLLERAPEILDVPLGEIGLEPSRRNPDTVSAAPAGPDGPHSDVGERILAAFRTHADRYCLRSTQSTATFAEVGTRVRGIAATLRETVPAGGLVLIEAARTTTTVEQILACLIAERPFLIVPDEAPAIRKQQLREAQLARWTLDSTGQPTATGSGPLLDNEVGYLCATSGTTGTPKLVLAPRRGLDLMLSWQPSTLGVTAADRLSLLSGLGHDPLLREILIAVTSGACLCVPGPEQTNPHRLADWLHEAEVTIVHTTPAMGRLIAGAVRSHSTPLRAVRALSLAGAALTGAAARIIAQGFPSARVLSTYGTTETVQVAGVVDVDQNWPSRPRSLIASSSPAATITVETAAGVAAAVNEPGEIVVSGASLFLGYLDAPRREPRRVYRTGDLGIRRPDGLIEFIGRRDRQVSRFGLRTELSEIEQTLLRHPQIDEAHVVAHDGPGADDPQLVAVASPLSADEPALMAWLAHRLPANALPDRLVTVDDIPLTPNGKPDVGRLLDWTRSRGSNGTVAEIIAQTVARLIGAPSLHVGQNFFEAGATSLTLLRAHGEICHSTGVDFEVIEMFTSPSARALSARISVTG